MTKSFAAVFDESFMMKKNLSEKETKTTYN